MVPGPDQVEAVPVTALGPGCDPRYGLPDKALWWSDSTGGPMGDRDLEIDGLIDEHRELMTIMASLRRAAGQPDAEVNGLFGELTAALAHHTEREEAGLFRTLREVEFPRSTWACSSTITDTSSSSSSRPGVTGTV